jgi:hypothetical protein
MDWAARRMELSSLREAEDDSRTQALLRALPQNWRSALVVNGLSAALKNAEHERNEMASQLR